MGLELREIIQALIDGEILVNPQGCELSFDPSFVQPFRFRIRNYEGVLTQKTFPVKSFTNSSWTIKRFAEDDPADWMELAAYARAKLWMQRCESARTEAAELRFKLKRLEKIINEFSKR